MPSLAVWGVYGDPGHTTTGIACTEPAEKAGLLLSWPPLIQPSELVPCKQAPPWHGRGPEAARHGCPPPGAGQGVDVAESVPELPICDGEQRDGLPPPWGVRTIGLLWTSEWTGSPAGRRRRSGATRSRRLEPRGTTGRLWSTVNIEWTKRSATADRWVIGRSSSVHSQSMH